MPNKRLTRETESAFEALLLKKNGDPKTVQDLFECFVAMHHDQKTDIGMVLEELRSVAQSVEKHATQDVNMTKEQFAEFMKGRDRILRDLEDRISDRIEVAIADRDLRLGKIDLEIKSIWQEIHRDPRRSGDDATENWGSSIFDDEGWEMKKAWRFLKYVVGGAVGVALVIVGDQISHSIWPT